MGAALELTLTQEPGQPKWWLVVGGRGEGMALGLNTLGEVVLGFNPDSKRKQEVIPFLLKLV